MGNPIVFIDPTGHFTEEAIVGFLRETYGEHWVAVYDAWRSDAEWWSMLSQAEAGDVLYGCIGENGCDRKWSYAFAGEGNHKLSGLLVPINGGWDRMVHSRRLDTIFSGGSGYHFGFGQFTWGGLFEMESGHLSNIFHRPSVSSAYQIQVDGDGEISEAAGYSFGTAAGATILCSFVSSPLGGAACGVALSTVTGTLPALSPDNKQDLDWVVISAGWEFTYRTEGRNLLLPGGDKPAARHVYFHVNNMFAGINVHFTTNYCYPQYGDACPN